MFKVYFFFIHLHIYTTTHTTTHKPSLRTYIAESRNTFSARKSSKETCQSTRVSRATTLSAAASKPALLVKKVAPISVHLWKDVSAVSVCP